MALQAATLLRASISERPMLAAAVKGDRNARVATTVAEEMCMFLDRLCVVNLRFSRRRVCLALCHLDRPLDLVHSSMARSPDIVARLGAT